MTAALLAGAIAGAAASGVTALVLSSGPGPNQPRAAGPDDGADLAAEVADLRAQNAELTRRLEGLEAQAAMATPVTRQPVAADEAIDVDELRDLLASFQTPDVAPPPRFQSLVDQAIEAREERERAEREEQRRLEREQRMDEQVARIAERLGLDPNQQAGMREILVERDQMREDMFTALRNNGGPPGDRGAMREVFQEMTQKTNAKLQALLTPQQYEQYQDQFADRGGRGGFGGRGRGGQRDG
jgi:hypothetical protein